MSTLTPDQAYAAMYQFLEHYYQLTKSDDVGNLLSSMSLLSNGVTADPAVAEDWQDAVQFALNGGEAGKLILGGKQ